MKKNRLSQIRLTNGGTMQLIGLAPVGFGTAIDSIGRVLEDSREKPDSPGFSREVGTVERVLGSGEDPVAWELKLSGNSTQNDNANAAGTKEALLSPSNTLAMLAAHRQSRKRPSLWSAQ